MQSTAIQKMDINDKHINRLDIADEIGQIEALNKGISFLSSALPDYPHQVAAEELAVILDCLSEKIQIELAKIKKVAHLED